MRRQCAIGLPRNHAIAATAETGHCRHAQQRIARQDTSVNQRTGQGQKSGWVTSRIADPRGSGNGITLSGDQLRKPINPVGMCSVLGLSVDQARIRQRRHIRSLTRGGIWQAQNRQIRRCHHLLAGCVILALLVIQRPRRDTRMQRQPVSHLQSRCAGSTVDENAVSHAQSHKRIGWFMQGWL